MRPHNNAVLHAKRLRIVTNKGIGILRGVDFELFRGELLGMVGEAGSGKTIAGLACLGYFRKGLQRTSGTMMVNPVDGTEPFDLFSLDFDTLRSLRGRRIAHISRATLALNPAMRVGEQILEVLPVHEYGAGEHERKQRVAEILTEVDLPSSLAFQRRLPHQLSAGQQQRIGIAMAFVMSPDVVIFDDPTRGLDATTRDHVLKAVQRMTALHHVAGLYLTRDLGIAAALADRLSILYHGEVLETGSREKILEQPAHRYTRQLLASVPGLADARVLTPTGARTQVSSAGQSPEPHPPARNGQRPLEVTDLSVAYGRNTVLRNIDLAVEPGSCTMLLGSAGAGKTTLTRAIAGLLRRYRGEVKLNGEVLARSVRKRSRQQRQQLQYLFASPYLALNPRHTLGKSLSIPLEMSGVWPAHARWVVVQETLKAVQLDAAAYHRRPQELTREELHRAAIARALVSSPSVLICDEITTGLEVSTQASIMALLNSLRESRGLSIVFATQDIALARQGATHIAVLNNGEIVDQGTVDEVLENPSNVVEL